MITFLFLVAQSQDEETTVKPKGMKMILKSGQNSE
jgi:hypothetical protein